MIQVLIAAGVMLTVNAAIGAGTLVVLSVRSRRYRGRHFPGAAR